MSSAKPVFVQKTTASRMLTPALERVRVRVRVRVRFRVKVSYP